MSLKIYSPANGQYVRLEDVNDPTFSSGVMGTGFGVIPQKGVVYAPAEDMRWDLRRKMVWRYWFILESIR